jgi:trehalose 6-phosphate phosphatase
VPGIVVLGQYGAEQWQDGALAAPDPAPGLAPMRAALPGVLDGTDPQVWIEDKTLGLVVHTRRSPDPDRELEALAPRVIALAEEHGLEASAGRAVVEVRSSGVDKGGAIRRLVAEHRPSAVLFGGDDLGDLPAYDAVEALRGEGTPGLTVCSASAEVPEVAARADLVVEGPDGMVGFLTDLADSIN